MQSAMHHQANDTKSPAFLTAHTTPTYIKSLLYPHTSLYITASFVCCIASTRTSLEGNRAMFNQIKLVTKILSENPSPDLPAVHTNVLPFGLKVVPSPLHPQLNLNTLAKSSTFPNLQIGSMLFLRTYQNPIYW